MERIPPANLAIDATKTEHYCTPQPFERTRVEQSPTLESPVELRSVILDHS